MTTYGEALLTARASLAEAGVEGAALDARLLLAAASGLDAARLVARGPEDLPPVAKATFDHHIARRRAGEPVARILGEKEFWSLPFWVGPTALVPRPETETLVEAALAGIGGRFPPDLTICDLGTGTGAILIALLRELPEARGVGTDIAPEALAVARLNAERLGVMERIDLVEADFAVAPDGPFHAVVANPPYIRSEAIGMLAKEVRDHDPRLALDGGADGLAAYRSILSRIDALLAPGGFLGFEVGDGQGEDVTRLCREAGLAELCYHPDLTGRARVVTAVRTMPEKAPETAKKALGKVRLSG